MLFLCLSYTLIPYWIYEEWLYEINCKFCDTCVIIHIFLPFQTKRLVMLAEYRLILFLFASGKETSSFPFLIFLTGHGNNGRETCATFGQKE